MVTIDAKNISDFTASILPNYTDLVAFPPIKEIKINEWAEHDEADVDLSKPMLDKKIIEISFLLSNKEKYHDLVNYLKSTTYRNWYFSEINKEFKLRAVSFSSYKEFEKKAEIKIKLYDDFPLRNFVYTAPSWNLGTTEWLLDGIEFAKYGVYILQGSEEIHQVNEFKDILEVSNSLMQGVKTWGQPLTLKSRRGNLKCFIRAHISDFWNFYYRLLHDLTKEGIRSLTTEKKSYFFYYNNCKVTDFKKNNNLIRCSFDLELIFI